MERRPQWAKTVSYVSTDSSFRNYGDSDTLKRLKAS